MTVNDSVAEYSQSDIFQFPNFNKVRFYRDEKALARIRTLRTNGKEAALYDALKGYIRNFGIQNFIADYNLLQEFAKLSETLGKKGEALLLYKLLLRHAPRDGREAKILQLYDSIQKPVAIKYVPLKEYYELVAYRREIDTLRPPHGILLNMGEFVNSAQEDYGPTIGNVDNLLFFTSKRNKHPDRNNRTYNEDLFYTLKQDSVWQFAEELKTINTSYNEGSATLSRDGKSLYFSRCNSPDSQGSCDLFVSEMNPDSTWGLPVNLGVEINSIYWDSQPSLSHSGDTLYFASDRLGGFGQADIYFAVKLNGKWSKARNIGPVINTRGHDVSPFYHHRHNVLYFSSNGHPINFGDFDIYKVYHPKGVWTEPVNIGPLVNGGGSEYYFTIDSHSRYLYYARSDENDRKNLDLHSFPVPMEAQPEAVINVTGTVVDEQTKKPVKGIVSIIDLDSGVEVAPQFLREDGSFDFKLINKRNYLLIIQGDDFFRIEELFFLEGDREFNIETDPIESRIAFKSLEFENGKADILENMHQDLDKLANFLIDHPASSLKISGHTDSQGREEANLKLSQARADAIKAYLVYTFKIDAARIEANGYGSSKPIVKEITEEDKKLNRRVEFEIFPKPE